MIKKIFIFVVGVCVFFSAYAGVDKNYVEKAEKYLNSITGLSGDFVQVSKGKKENGKFSMLRPSRIRLDYDNLPVQLISDGADLYFYDKSLDQITTVPITSTPAGILVRKNINLQTSDIVVEETKENKSTFSLKMFLRANKGLGNMTIVFDKNPVKLNSWTVVDATGTKTDVVFSDLVTKTKFDKNYFQIQRHKTVNVAGGDDYYD